MAAPKGKETIDKLFDEIINDMAENGMSAVKAMKGKMSCSTFYDLLSNDVEKSNKYTRATELRTERMAEETLEISDSVEDDIITLPDGREVVNNNVIQRDRLRVDTRKWLLSKMNPKKYGDKIEVDTNQKHVIEYANVSKQFPDKD